MIETSGRVLRGRSTHWLRLLGAAVLGAGLLGAVGCGGSKVSTAQSSAAVAIVPAVLPSGMAGVAYGAAVAASAGTTPYTFAVTSGKVPTGLTLSAAGALAGTPTIAGTFLFTVTVTDAALNQASAMYSVTIASAVSTVTVGPAVLPVALRTASYTAALQLAGGLGPYTVTQTGGTLPTGVGLSAGGVVSGIATVDGSYTFTVRVADSSTFQQTATAAIALTVVDATVAVDTTVPLTVVPQTFFGMHTSVYDTSLSDTAALPALLARTGITTLRYPGGSYADRYHWAQHSLTPAYASSPPACDGSGPYFEGFVAPGADFGSFVKTLAATGTQGLITINYGTSVSNASASLSAGNGGVANHCSEPNTVGQPQEAAAWVAYANGSPASTQRIGVDAVGFDWKTVGFWAGMRASSPIAIDDGYNFLRINQAAAVGVKYWEIGNEMYYNGWSQNLNFEADLHAPYVYPNGPNNGTYNSRNQLAALSPTAYGANAIPFVQAMKAVDPTILIGVDFASPGATDPIPLNWNPDLAQSACAAGSFDLAIIHYYPGTYQAVQASELLSLPQSDLPRQIAGIKANLAQYCANASAIHFFLTETSPNAALAPGFPQQALGLFVINEYLTSLKTGVLNIDWLELHNGTYLDESENPGPVYYGIQLAHLLAGVGDTLVQANASGPNVLSWATLKANGQKGVLLINADPLNPATVQVTVAGAALGSTATEYSYGLTTTQASAALAGSSFAVAGSTFSVTVPAYTAVELNIP